MRINYIFLYLVTLFCINCGGNQNSTNTQTTATTPEAAPISCEGKLSTIKSDPRCQQWVKQLSWLFEARTKDAEVRIDQNGSLTWLNGVWLDGTWENGTWELGQWMDGTWKNGVWKYGGWFGGTWENGTWHRGVWEGGEWLAGTWLGGHWRGDPAKHPNKR